MVTRLTRGELMSLSESAGWFTFSRSESEKLLPVANQILQQVEEAVEASLDAAPASAPRPERTFERASDPLNAIVRWCDARGSEAGSLAGMRIGVKDSMAIAGIPLSLGSSALSAYVPEEDCDIVAQVLRQGADVVAVTNMDSFALSGGGDTSDFGPVRNPHDPGRSAGGSSGGSAASLYYSELDGCFGTDQGGSIRLPAAWCGVLGLKPTHGRVSYAGVVGLSANFDHVGPMARRVNDLARLFAAVDGCDGAGRGPRATAERAVRFEDMAGVRVGVIVEGFGEASPAERATSAAVRDFAETLAVKGARVSEVGWPMQNRLGGFAFSGFLQGIGAIFDGHDTSFENVRWRGAAGMATALRGALQDNADLLSPQTRLMLVLAFFLSRTQGGATFAATQGERLRVRASLEARFEDADFLLLPTAPYTAYEFDDSLDIGERATRGWDPVRNCIPTNVSGHPAISLPAAMCDGLPVGVMLVGRFGHDESLIAFARAVERECGWASLPDPGYGSAR